ncbi:transcriptional regulator, partial [Bacillus thuringiensis]
KSAGNKIELKKVYVELAEHFSSLSRFEESNRYYRLVIDLMNDNKEE